MLKSKIMTLEVAIGFSKNVTRKACNRPQLKPNIYNQNSKATVTRLNKMLPIIKDARSVMPQKKQLVHKTRANLLLKVHRKHYSLLAALSNNMHPFMNILSTIIQSVKFQVKTLGNTRLAVEYLNSKHTY